MKSSKTPPKSSGKNDVTNVLEDSSSSESKTKCFSKNLVQCRQKIWLVTGGIIVIALLLGLIIQSLQKRENLEDTVLGQSLKDSSLLNEFQKEATSSHKSENHENSLRHESFSSSNLPTLAAKTGSETIPPSEQRDGALDDKVRILEERLLVLEKIHERAPQVWQSYHMLLVVLSSEEPFENELNDFKKLTHHNLKITKAVESLEPYAKSGIPTFEKLIKSFGEVKGEIFSAYDQNLSWWEKAKLHLKNLIDIRRIDGKQEELSSPAEIVQQAIQGLSQKKLEQAIFLLSSLKRDNTPILNAWLAHAQARQEMSKARYLLKNQIFLEMISPQ